MCEGLDLNGATTGRAELERIAVQYVGNFAHGAVAVPALFADEVSLWWNAMPDGKVMGGTEFANALAAGHPPEHIADYRIEVDAVRYLDDGFVVALSVRGTEPSGEAVAAHVCQIVTVADGRIVRWEEYLDRQQHAAFHP